MKKPVLVLAMLLIAASILIIPGTAAAQDSAVSVVGLDENTFVTVQETGNGDMISLYKVRGDQVYLVDVLFNTTARDVDLPKRYTHHIELENR